MLPGIFGGEEGITANRALGPHPFGLDFASQLQVYYIVAFWALLAALLMPRFTRTPVGRMCNAVRDNPERAEFVGYNTQARALHRVRGGGDCSPDWPAGCMRSTTKSSRVDAVSAQRSGTVLLMAYIGGAAQFLGPILGAIVITWLQVSLSRLHAAWLLYLGLFFMAIVLYAPGGLDRPHDDARAHRAHARLCRRPAKLRDRAGSSAGSDGGRRRAARDELSAFDATGGRVAHEDTRRSRRHRDARGPGSSRARWCSPDGSCSGARVRWSRQPGSAPATNAWHAAGRRHRERLHGRDRDHRIAAASRRRPRAARRAQAFRRDRGHPRCARSTCARRAARDHRTERRRQVDAVQSDQRPLRADAGDDPARRRGHRRREAVRGSIGAV